MICISDQSIHINVNGINRVINSIIKTIEDIVTEQCSLEIDIIRDGKDRSGYLCSWKFSEPISLNDLIKINKSMPSKWTPYIKYYFLDSRLPDEPYYLNFRDNVECYFGNYKIDEYKNIVCYTYSITPEHIKVFEETCISMPKLCGHYLVFDNEADLIACQMRFL